VLKKIKDMIVEEITGQDDGMREERRAESCRLAIHLFLYPEFVVRTSGYWLSQYTNYMHAKNEEDFFGDIVAGLLQRPPSLRIYANEGMARDDCVTLSHRSTLHFVGGKTHPVPLTYYSDIVQDEVDSFLFCLLGSLVQPAKKAFIHRTASGTSGEIELGMFVHDSLLCRYYEPSLYIITLYKLHLAALIGLSGGQVVGDWLPRHRHSLKAINENSLDMIRCFSTLCDETLEKERLATLKKELRELYDILNTNNLDKARASLSTLWEKKATQCANELIVVRSGGENPRKY
jgi:hypothetical protein